MRKTRTTPLIVALLLAPAVAGTVGGALVWLVLSVQLVPEQGLDEAMLVLMIGAVPALIVAVGVTYLLGGPVMLAAWALAHFMKWRSPARMGLTLGLTGLVFAFFFFVLSRMDGETGLDGDAILLLATLPCGFVAGFLGGGVIGMLGYEKHAQDETDMGAKA